MTGLLDGRVALITGAGAGIGAATAIRFASEGATLWLNDRDADGLASTIDAVTEVGGDVEGVVGDAGDPADVEAWVSAAVDRHGRIEVLYANVGVSRNRLVADLDDRSWHLQQRLTLDSVFYATRAVLPHMVAAGRGSIIAMASGAGVGGHAGLGGYAAAKAGVINLMETVATEYGGSGVRANAVTPGPTATPPLLDHLSGLPGGVDAAVRDHVLGRLTEPDEVAAIVTWLASDESSSVSGTCIRSNLRATSPRPTLDDNAD